MKDLRTIILAAGKGTRMKSKNPKVLHKVCGRPIIQYVLDVAKSVGSLETYVVLGHQAKEVEAYLGSKAEVVYQKEMKGTADAVRSAELKLRNYTGDVLVLCGDTPLLNKIDIRKIVKLHKKNKNACTFLTAKVSNPFGYGRIIRGSKGTPVAIREEKDAVGYEKDIRETNVGVYCFSSQDLFDGLKEIKVNAKKKEFYLTDIIELFAHKKFGVQTVETADPQEGLGVNTRQDLAVAESVVQKSILAKLMLNGVTIIDSKTTFISADAKIGKDTIIRPCSYIEPNVTVGEDCIIGPFSRIRSGSKIGNNTEIGNFTEVVRTKMGERCFMKHFSYLGDAVVGNEVNIGAGSVTANFDGVNKHITHIDDQAFIGCDAILVSPVKVGKKAVVGAGSVVPKGNIIPPKGVVVGVPAKPISSKGKKKK